MGIANQVRRAVEAKKQGKLVDVDLNGVKATVVKGTKATGSVVGVVATTLGKEVVDLALKTGGDICKFGLKTAFRAVVSTAVVIDKGAEAWEESKKNK